MKFPIISTALVTLCALFSTAQAELKIASVNVMELYKKYYKRFDAESVLRQKLQEVQKEINGRNETIQKLQNELQNIANKKDPSLSNAAAAKIDRDIANKQRELQAQDQERRDFVVRTQKLINAENRKTQLSLIKDIQAAIQTVADQNALDMVIDTNAQSLIPDGAGSATMTPVFPYLKKDIDMTPEVLKVLNSGAPAGFDPDAELQRLQNMATPAAQ